MISGLLIGCQNTLILEPTTTFSFATDPVPQPTSTIQPTAQIGMVESPIMIGYITPDKQEVNQKSCRINADGSCR